ncbi:MULTISPECIES: DUF6455 family protein [unclassified Leisingera]|uniref:DUF6455 family protein n=1 Tax=unclassified Leisingera TaxID=2614906 RepID=UPI0010119C69|nr:MULTISPECIES: DUF6455 family protein [unclassified Leisingera]MBQ4827240.1 hypothetical protein [Leisingera sp. HS039]MCF6433762.1 DUF6455 family protein [Leisingera sp. MMG026]QAX29005.1 hypothetical protein ETW24_06315 [Leisingera sp. NJS204]QBR36984.1 hypothetical protein ETW23_13405 [Leisingera sp. NJS201]
MQPLGDPLYHLRLMTRMGQAAGADLTSAFAAGDISHADWAAMITRCRGCEARGQCEAFLSANDHTRAPMPGCRNADALMQLKDRSA